MAVGLTFTSLYQQKHQSQTLSSETNTCSSYQTHWASCFKFCTTF